MSSGPHSGQLEQALGEHYARFDQNRCVHGEGLAGYLAHDLPATERALFETHLEACEECRDDLNAARELEGIWDETQARKGSVLDRWLGLSLGLRWSAAAAGLVLVVAVVWLTAFGQGTPGPERLAIKGGWKLHVAAVTEGQTVRVVSGSKLATGAQLGFFVSNDRPGYLMILYADEAAEIIRLFPAKANWAAPLEPGHERRLPDGAVATPGSGCEWVIGLYSEKAFSYQEARLAVGRMLKARNACRLARESLGLEGLDVQVVQVVR